jgi:SAM-dependent methyltransferase
MQSAQFALHAQIEERHWWFTARRRILRTLVENVLEPVRPGDEPNLVIDVGCGTGANIASLADRYRCVGIDTSPEAIERARERYPRVDFVCGYAPDDLGDLAEQASLFLLTDVLEHVPDDFALLSRLFAAAAPGAFFLITVPANLALWSEHDESFGHYRRYNRERLESVWSGLPVTPLLCSYYNTRLYPVVRGVRWWNRRRGRASGAAGTDFNLPPAPVNRTLERIFAGEARRLVDLLHRRSTTGYARGVSLIALLQREAGEIEVRHKPAAAGQDYFDPARGELIACAT